MSAATQPGSLEASPAATDYFQVRCFDDGHGPPASLVAQVTSGTAGGVALANVQIQKGFAARSATDPQGGDGAAGPAIFVNGGAGLYDVFVDKTAEGSVAYTLELACTTAANGAGTLTGVAVSGSEPAANVPALGPVGALGLLAALLAAARFALRRGAALVLILALAPAIGAAHTQSETLEVDPAATDFFQVTCSDDGSGPPGSLLLEVEATSGAAEVRVSAQAQKGSLLTNTTDAVNGDGSASPFVAVNAGTGVYDVLIDKSGAGVASYTLTFHCKTGPDGTGVHTGTTIVNRQDQ